MPMHNPYEYTVKTQRPQGNVAIFNEELWHRNLESWIYFHSTKNTIWPWRRYLANHSLPFLNYRMKKKIIYNLQGLIELRDSIVYDSWQDGKRTWLVISLFEIKFGESMTSRKNYKFKELERKGTQYREEKLFEQFYGDCIQFSPVTQSCPTLCKPMNHSMPGLPVHHQLLESSQIHVCWVGNAVQPSHLLSSPSPPAPNPSQHQSLFQWVNSLHQVAKVLEFQLLQQSLQWTPRTDLL